MMDDFISRADTLEAYSDLYWIDERLLNFKTELDKVYDNIRAIPSAQQKQGHYIKGESGEWYCSECKRIDDKYSVANFCWYCGARMTEKSE